MENLKILVHSEALAVIKEIKSMEYPRSSETRSKAPSEASNSVRKQLRPILLTILLAVLSLVAVAILDYWTIYTISTTGWR